VRRNYVNEIFRTSQLRVPCPCHAWKENDSKEWSSFLVLRIRLQNREPEKERKRKIFLRGLSVGESQCKHNRQLFLDSYRGTKFSTGAEIHEEKMCELLNAVPKFIREKRKMRFFSYSRQDQPIRFSHCNSHKILLTSAKYRISISERE